MELLKILKKYRYDFNLNKSNLYKELEANKQIIIDAGFSFNPKNVNDLFALEVIYRGLENKLTIESCYDNFVTTNYDTFEYINYDEKRKMFNHDINNVIQDMISFKDKKSKVTIYIPYLESFINQRYLEDFQVLTLKQHQEYLKNYPKSLNNIFDLYHIQVYLSKFSSLQVIGRDKENIYLYYSEFKTVYIYNEKECLLIDEFCIVDKYSELDPNLKKVKELIKLFLDDNSDLNIIEHMKEHQYIGQKTYKKLIKKLGK